MTIFQSIILGIIEGITEFLPISSTGHLMLAGNIINIADTDFLKSFGIIIQFGAIVSVIVLYFKSLVDLQNIKKLIVAFIPTGIIGLLFYKIIKTIFLDSKTIVLWSLLLGGIAIIAFELIFSKSQETGGLPQKDDFSKITYKQSFLIGLFQSIAIVPGVSRSAATILGGLLLGLKRKTIVEFSFLLAVPTMLVASVFDLFKNASSFSGDQFGVLVIGFVTSFVVAMLAIKFFLKFIQSHTFIPFGIYRIILVTVLILFVV